MYKKHISILAFILVQTILFAQDIALPQPNISDSLSLHQAFVNRQSTRSFDAERELNSQEISNILWAAYGFNRDGKRTVPSGHNSQEYSIYVFTKKGVYLWNDVSNVLEQKSKGDNRNACGTQAYVKDASVNLVYVANFSKLEKYTTPEAKVEAANVNCGFIGQNVYLYCAAKGLGAIFRGGIDKVSLHKFLKLKKYQNVMYSQSIGFIKE